MSRWLCMGVAGLLTASCVLAESPVAAEPVAEAVAKAEADKTKAATSTNGVEGIVGEWLGKDVYVYARDVWMLEITYLNLDTRSEGQQGRLLEDGKPVDAAKKGESLVTPLGLLKYYGGERKHPWDVTGWNFADRRKIRRSSDLPRPDGKPGAVTDPGPGVQL